MRPMTDTRPAPRHLLWPDLVRIFAVYFVIVLHISEGATNHWGKISLFDWMSGNVYNSFSRICVPLLFMITGSLLLGKREELPAFFIKRLRKIAIPLLAWSFIYLLWSNDYSSFTPVNALKAMILAIVRGPVYYHLWFLYALAGVYLLIPILRAFVQSANETLIWYLIVLWFIVGTLLAYAEEITGFKLGASLSSFIAYTGFVVAGYQLGRIRFTRRWIIALSAGLILLTSVTIYVTYAATVSAGRLMGRYYAYNSINVVLMSVCAYILLKAVGEHLYYRSGGHSPRAFSLASLASFGIYLVHIIVLSWFLTGTFGFKLLPTSGPPIIMVPLLALLVFLISFGIVYVIQKIPVLREIV